MHPTPRAMLLFGLGVPLSVLLVLIDERLWPLAIAYLGGAVIVTGIDGILCPPARGLVVAPDIPGLLYVGERDALVVRLGSPAPRRTVVELACEVGPELASPPVQSGALARGHPAALTIPLVPRRRGTAALQRLWLRWRGPLGLMARQRVDELSATVPIVPNIRAVRREALKFSARHAMHGVRTQTERGEGSEFEALREYVSGLDRRWIDWKRSARHHHLLCKEFRAERNHPIVLAFDTGHLMSEPLAGIPKLDHAINAGLVLGYACLRGGDRVGVFGFDARVRLYTEPVGGLASFQRLQRATAELDYRLEETNFTLALADLAGRLNRRALVIVLSEFVDTVTAELMVENLERLATRHLVLFVTLQDPDLNATVDQAPRSMRRLAGAVVAEGLLRDRMVVFERLRRLGIHCLDAPSEAAAGALIDRYLAIKARELI